MDIKSTIKNKYKALSNIDFNFIDSTNKNIKDGRQLEFYPADESWNPIPGKPTVEIFNKNLSGYDLENAVVGDLLHQLPKVDKQYAEMKKDFLNSLNENQIIFSKNKYLKDVSRGEKRSFNDWMESNWGDALIRGYLTPDKNDEFRKQGVYTPEQQQKLEKMKYYVSSGVVGNNGNFKNGNDSSLNSLATFIRTQRIPWVNK